MTHFPTRTRTSTQAHGSPFDTRARAFLFYNIYPTCATLLLLLRKSIQRNSVKQRSARGKRVGVRARARARARACAWIIFAYTAAHAISEVVLALTGSERVFAGLRSHRSVSASTPGSNDPPRASSSKDRAINREEEEEEEEGEEEEEKELAGDRDRGRYETNVTRGRILMQRLR